MGTIVAKGLPDFGVVQEYPFDAEGTTHLLEVAVQKHLLGPCDHPATLKKSNCKRVNPTFHMKEFKIIVQL